MKVNWAVRSRPTDPLLLSDEVQATVTSFQQKKLSGGRVVISSLLVEQKNIENGTKGQLIHDRRESLPPYDNNDLRQKTCIVMVLKTLNYFIEAVTPKRPCVITVIL